MCGFQEVGVPPAYGLPSTSSATARICVGCATSPYDRCGPPARPSFSASPKEEVRPRAGRAELSR